VPRTLNPLKSNMFIKIKLRVFKYLEDFEEVEGLEEFEGLEVVQ